MIPEEKIKAPKVELNTKPGISIAERCHVCHAADENETAHSRQMTKSTTWLNGLEKFMVLIFPGIIPNTFNEMKRNKQINQ